MAAIIFAVVGQSLADARRVPFNSFGGIIWVAALFVSFLLGLLFYAQFILPLRGHEGWSEGLRLLWRHYSEPGQRYLNTLLYPSAAASARLRRKNGSPPTNKLGLPASFFLLRAGILKSHQVLALTRGSQFARPVGPGFVMLQRTEAAAHLIDLRKQLRRQPVKANTRDGIPIETTITVIFRIQQAPFDLPGSEPYPYEHEAIFRVSYVNSIDAREKVRDWLDQLNPRAADMLVDEISHYTLDELYLTNNGGGGRLDQIKIQLKQRLERLIDPNGIEIIAVGVAPFTLPKAVVDQRINTWRADWERKIKLQQATSDAEAMRRIKKARARAQIEIIEDITQNIAAVRRAGGDDDLSNIIMLRMIEALKEAKSNASLQLLLPQQVMAELAQNASRHLQAWLNQSEDSRS